MSKRLFICGSSPTKGEQVVPLQASRLGEIHASPIQEHRGMRLLLGSSSKSVLGDSELDRSSSRGGGTAADAKRLPKTLMGGKGCSWGKSRVPSKVLSDKLSAGHAVCDQKARCAPA